VSLLAGASAWAGGKSSCFVGDLDPEWVLRASSFRVPKPGGCGSFQGHISSVGGLVFDPIEQPAYGAVCTSPVGVYTIVGHIHDRVGTPNLYAFEVTIDPASSSGFMEVTQASTGNLIGSGDALVVAGCQP